MKSPQQAVAGRGLGAHIRGWMLAVGLVPLAILFLYGYLAARSALVEASDDHLTSVAVARRAQIEAWLRERLTDLEVISRSQDCIALVQQASAHRDHASICRYLDSFQTGARDYQVLALYDLDWTWVASQSGAEAHREELVDAEIREGLRTAGGPVLAPAHPHELLGTGFHVANALGFPGDPPVGYVVASLDLTGTFAPILQDGAGLGRTGRVLLADRSGRLLLQSHGEPAVGEAVDPELLEQTSEARSGSFHYRRPSGERVFAGYAVIPEQGWILAAVVDEDEALALLYSLRRGFVVAGLITLAGVIVLSSRSSRRLSAPLGALAAAARRVKGGGQSERVPELEGREVAEVGRAFNEMLDALEEMQRQRIQAGTLAAVGELSSNVVHEMRNRLSSVKMNLQAMERRLRSEEDYAELARIALEQVRRTEETLTDLLNYARPVQPVMEEIPVEAFLIGLAGQFRAEALNRRIELTVDDRTRGGRIRGDRRLFEQALTNLVRNALEATGPGGHVRLRAIPRPEQAGWVTLEVEDDGPGLDGVSPEELFQPFFTTKERGAGLGLAHAKKITELHGGRIIAANAEGGGAVFRVELPATGGTP